jgi:plastocyanin
MAEPVGAYAASTAGTSPSIGVAVTLAEVDLKATSAGLGTLWVSAGYGRLDDEEDSFDRSLYWFSVEPTFTLCPKLDSTLRYSEIGTYSKSEGYLFDGRPFANAWETHGYDTSRLTQLELGLAWRPQPNMIVKGEVGYDSVHAISQSPSGTTRVASSRCSSCCASDMGRPSRPRLPLVFLLALSAGVTAQTEEPRATAPMRELAALLRQALARVERAEPAGAAAEGARLAELAAALPRLAPDLQTKPSVRNDRALAADIRWHAERLSRHAAALAASGADLAAQAESLAHIRRACTSCHLEFRPRADAGIPWPANGEAIHGRVRVQTLDGAIREDSSHVVVFLEGVPREARPPALRERIVQKDRTFVPELLVVTAGTTVEFPNHDAVFHNVFSKAVQDPFDLGLYGGGETQSRVFRQPGLVKIYCNIHPEMVAHVLVLGGPDATVVAPSGFFALPDLPAGKLVLRTWSEFGGDLSREVEVEPESARPLVLDMKETRRRQPHANKFGHPYREKY